MDSTILFKEKTKTADRIHLENLRQPVAVDDFDGKRPTTKVTDIVRIQLKNKLANPLIHNNAASSVWAYIHQPNETNPPELTSMVISAGCSIALKTLKV
ncbi:uncharacterized protein ZBIST_5051 [Zygosaccharomyces bailii]|nr:uncharacterized protein ZBIST_5051 [Zygosaccharomyces bailii]